jgi:hypothetical protein
MLMQVPESGWAIHVEWVLAILVFVFVIWSYTYATVATVAIDFGFPVYGNVPNFKLI